MISTSPYGTLTLVVDPAASATLPTLEKALRARGLSNRAVVAADEPGGVNESAREAIAQGATFIVGVGDDKTANEIVNALFDPETGERLSPELVLGMIAAGPGPCDLVKTFGLPAELGHATAHLAGEDYYDLDIVRATATAKSGESSSRYFAILAEAGLGARQSSWERRLSFLGGRWSRFLGFWLAYAGTRSCEMRVDTGKRKVFEGRAYDVVVGNCQFFRDGLRLSPRSYPGDGELDVLAMKGPKSDAYTTIPKMFRGEHVPSDNITELTGRSVKVTSPGSNGVPVHVDGIVIGRTPATFEVIPAAVRLKV